MRTVSGTWYDQDASAAHEARLEAGARTVRVHLQRRQESAPLSALAIEPRLGNTPRRLVFPGRGVFETLDHETLEAVLRAAGAGGTGWLHAIESRWWIGVAALVPVALLAWWTAVSGVPALAGAVAHRLPPSLTRDLGAAVVRSLESIALEDTRLPAGRREALQSRFGHMVRAAAIEADCELRFYAAPRIGPNALAVPPCTVVMTDELVHLAGDDGEILAVLAHELGHVHHRHALRHIVQGALLAFLVVAVSGDATQIPAGLAGAPAALLELRFSREFERESDAFAHAFMQRQGIALAAFPRILRRLERGARGAGARESDWSRYLATHPLTEERVRRFEQ